MADWCSCYAWVPVSSSFTAISSADERLEMARAKLTDNYRNQKPAMCCCCIFACFDTAIFDADEQFNCGMVFIFCQHARQSQGNMQNKYY